MSTGNDQSAFERSLALRADGNGRYRGDVDDALAFGDTIHGGFGLALAVQAASEDLDAPDLPFRTATALFVSPLPAGAVRAEVQVLRRGRSMAHCAVDIRPDGASQPSLSVVAAFGRSRPGRNLRQRTAPETPSPGDAPSFQEAPAGAGPAPPWVFLPAWETIERRIADGHGWWNTDRPPGRSEGALWLRYRDTPRLDNGQVNPLAHLALSDMLAQAMSDGLAAEDFSFVSIDHTVHLVGHSTDDWCLVSHRCEHLLDGYASLRGEVWDEHGILLATSTQLGLVVDS